MTDIQKARAKAARYALACALIIYGLWGIAHEKEPRWNDVHSILVRIGLALLPAIPEDHDESLVTKCQSNRSGRNWRGVLSHAVRVEPAPDQRGCDMAGIDA